MAPLLANADEVIGTGTPAAPNGAVRHPIRFTLNHMLNYWVWPATQTAGVGSCTTSERRDPDGIGNFAGDAARTVELLDDGTGRGDLPAQSLGGDARLRRNTSPQAAIIITGFRNYGIILADNGDSGGLIGTPDARWNDDRSVLPDQPHPGGFRAGERLQPDREQRQRRDGEVIFSAAKRRLWPGRQGQDRLGFYFSRSAITLPST